MATGFELIHPCIALSLMKYEKHHSLCVALLSWCIDKAKQEFTTQLDGHELSVIKVTLHGSPYPVIGLRCDVVDPDVERLAEWLEHELDALLPSYPVIDFIEFVSDKTKDWRLITKELMSP